MGKMKEIDLEGQQKEQEKKKPTIYKDYIIEENDYPHPVYKIMYYHKDDTDGKVDFAKTEDEAKLEIDELLEEQQ